jgi:hypothetical protein
MFDAGVTVAWLPELVAHAAAAAFTALVSASPDEAMRIFSEALAVLEGAATGLLDPLVDAALPPLEAAVPLLLKPPPPQAAVLRIVPAVMTPNVSRRVLGRMQTISHRSSSDVVVRRQHARRGGLTAAVWSGASNLPSD